MLIRRMQYMDMMNFSLKQANFLMKEQRNCQKMICMILNGM